MATNSSAARRWLVAVAAVAVVAAAPFTARSQDVNEASEKAMKAAAQHAAPSVVKIDTSGGTETIAAPKGGGGPPQPGLRKGVGPTTGLIVDADGYVVTSAFNFANKPTDIYVTVPGRPTALVAKIVANDTTRMLTLLKVDAKDLPVPAAVPKADVRVGQWALALGRTLDTNPNHPPSVSAGIVSARNRIWGKAIQTDAKVSPVNYGGPLVALDGRVFGVIVPASSTGEGETNGVEWYDSGIGFAVPLEDVLAAVPRMKGGKDLRRGLLGVTPEKAEDMYNAPAVIGTILPDSAADRAGVKAGDRLTKLDGKPIANYSAVMHVLGPKYEGDVIEVRVERAGKEVVFDKVALTGTVSAYTRPYLGILPMRDDPGPGVEVRYVYPKSPADAAGVKAGDRVMKVGPAAAKELAAVADRGQLTALVAKLPSTAAIKLELKRKDGKTESVSAKLTAAPDDLVPDKMPPLPSSVGRAGEKSKGPAAPKLPVPPKKGGGPKPETAILNAPPAVPPGPFDAPKADDPKAKSEVEKGLLKKTNAALGREYWVFVPDDYDPKVAHGLIVWFHLPGKGGKDAEDMKRTWRDFCEDHHFIMMGPKSQNVEGWLPSETEGVMQDVRAVVGQYTIDKSRVVAHGMGVGGQMAFYVGFNARDTFRGVAAVGAALGTPPKDATADQPLAFFISGGDKDPLIKKIKESRDTLVEKKFPVVFREMTLSGKEYFDTSTFLDLLAWMDSLDRI